MSEPLNSFGLGSPENGVRERSITQITAKMYSISVYKSIKECTVNDFTILSFLTTVVPVMAPENIVAVNTSSTSILLTWLPIPPHFSNGRILEYRITYFEVEDNDISIRNKGSWQSVIDGEKLSYNITGLERFTKYHFRMAGINRRGVGVDSMPITAITDEDSKFIISHYLSI